MRGAAEWEDADGVHYPDTWAHGGYNRETTILGGLPVPNEDLVNLPNWLVLQLRIEAGEAVRLADAGLLECRHELNVQHATAVPAPAAGMTTAIPGRELRDRLRPSSLPAGPGSGRETPSASIP